MFLTTWVTADKVHVQAVVNLARRRVALAEGPAPMNKVITKGSRRDGFAGRKVQGY